MDLGIRDRVALVTGAARSLGKADAVALAAEGCRVAIVDLNAEGAEETAKEIANKSPDAVRAAKRLLGDAVAVDAAAGLMAESVEQQKLIGSPNQLEAILSNLQKRAANYKD